MAVEEQELNQEDEITLHRAERFLSLGFKHDDAFNLAEARGKDGFHLYWGDVQKILARGATHAQVLAIFT